jgi:PAP2 superfamily
MGFIRHTVAGLLIAALSLTAAQGALAAQTKMPAEQVLQTWYKLVLELVRHTATYSPPVASRSFAYIGVTAFEAAATGPGDLHSLSGQLNGMGPMPAREAGAAYDDAVVVQAAMAASAQAFFSNTGPTGQRAMKAMAARLAEGAAVGVADDVTARSIAYGEAVAAAVVAWSADDGGATVTDMGFPLEYALAEGPDKWVPTSKIMMQQKPLLPDWGNNRPFAMPAGTACPLPPPPAYSEDPASEFYKQALEVAEVKKGLTADQRAIARFWSDDPMLSPTPPGHWISIALQILERDKASLDDTADVLARLGIAEADAFIGCWQTKYQVNLLRPVTYIRRTMDPKWESTMTTPPFPEYPSGHSVQSAAAAEVLTAIYGEPFAFDDATHADDGVKPRSFASFRQAAEEAGISRLYGGIHFRAAIERGLDQGRCIGAFAAALKTRG